MKSKIQEDTEEGINSGERLKYHVTKFKTEVQ